MMGKPVVLAARFVTGHEGSELIKYMWQSGWVFACPFALGEREFKETFVILRLVFFNVPWKNTIHSRS